MQSFLQYRRLRKDVQIDLARTRQEKPPASTGSSTPDVGSKKDDATDTGSRKGPDIDATSTPLTDGSLVPGVTATRPDEGSGEITFVVGWKDNDPSNPLEWSLTKKWFTMVACCILCIALTMLATVEGPSQDAFDAHFGVNPLAGSMDTGE